MSTLWTRDPETYRALGGVLRHRNRRPRPETGSWWAAYNGRIVVIARPTRMYGWSMGKPVSERTVNHLADRVAIAWRRGRFLGAMIAWECGSTATEFELSDEVTLRWCSTCWLRHNGYSSGDYQLADAIRRYTD